MNVNENRITKPEAAAAAAQDEGHPPPSNTTTTTTTAAAPATGSASIHTSAHSTTSNIGQRNSRKSTRVSIRRHSSKLFAAVRSTFVRKNALHGASVETLRGTSGADFEGYAMIHRGDATISFLCCCCTNSQGGGGRDGKLSYLLIKGYHCFVYENETSSAPKYAIELIHLKARIINTTTHAPESSSTGPTPSTPNLTSSSNPTTTTVVVLETGLGDVEYQFTFTSTSSSSTSPTFVANKFCNAISIASNEANAEEIRKRLGHEPQRRNRRTSVKYAQAIGEVKAKDQPSAPVTPGEVLAAMPISTAY